MSQARKILSEEGRRTVGDDTYVAACKNKWAPLLEGIPARSAHDQYVRGITAMIMENEARHLRSLSEETRMVNTGSFTKFIFPVLRRVFPNLIANEIVSVQPMTAPVGAVFFLDYVYGTTKGGTTEGNIFPRDFDRDYSSEFINGEPLATGDGAKYGGAAPTAVLTAVLNFTPVRPLDTTRGFSVVIKEINATTGADVQVATDNGTGGFTFSPTGANVAGMINYANGSVASFNFQNVPASGNPIKAYYYYDGELNSKIPQVNLDIKKAPVEAQPRRLKALYSSEAAEDLRTLHGVDAETELVSSIAQEIALEIDREIINDLLLLSTGTTGTFDRIPPGGVSEIDHLRAMITPISTVSNLIHKKSLRAPANWIVTSPEVSALFAQLTTHGDFRPLWGPIAGGQSSQTPIDMIMPGGAPHGQFGIYKTGTLLNKWVVYEDPFFTRNKMLIGLKGASYLDAGYAWAPYIPLQVTPTFLDPNDFSFRKGMRTRYAKKALRQEFYGQLGVTNL
jgi:hypothetical protein